MAPDDDKKRQLPQVTPLGPPESVPVFNCVIFVSRTSSGATARVANLPELEIQAASEREAIMKAVTGFKSRIAAVVASGEKPSFIPGPWEPRAGESQRLIAVHL